MAKIAVVGCGAMGSVYAALMVDAGHEVHAVTLWADHAEAMATKGLRCEGASGDRTVPIHASTTTDGIGPCDLDYWIFSFADHIAAGSLWMTPVRASDKSPPCQGVIERHRPGWRREYYRAGS